MYGGQIVQLGTPQELFENPSHTFVGYFIGSPGINLMPCSPNGSGALVGDHHISLPPGLIDKVRDDAGKLELGIRPEFLRLARSGEPGSVPVAIEAVEDLGNYKLATVRLDDHRLTVKLSEDEQVPADAAAVVFPPEWTKLYQDGVLVA